MTNIISITAALLITSLVISPAFAQEGVPGQNEGVVPAEAQPPAKKKIDQAALEFMMLCNATSMFHTENERYPKSKNEFLEYLDEMAKISPNLAPLLVSIKANDLVVPGNTKPAAADVILKYRRLVGEHPPYKVLLGSLKVVLQEEKP